MKIIKLKCLIYYLLSIKILNYFQLFCIDAKQIFDTIDLEEVK